MLVNFKTSVTYKRFLLDNCVRSEAAFLGHSSIFCRTLSDANMVFCVTGKMLGFPHEFLIKWENAAKSALWQEPGISIPILLPSYLSFCSIELPLWYTAISGWYMCFHTNFPWHVNFNETTLSYGKNLEYLYPYFYQDWFVFLPSNSRPMKY